MGSRVSAVKEFIHVNPSMFYAKIVGWITRIEKLQMIQHEQQELIRFK